MNEFDTAYNKLIDEYIKSEGLDLNPNSLIPSHIRHEKLKKDIKAQAEPEAIKEYLNIAMDSLINDGVNCVEYADYEHMIAQFSEIPDNLNKIDLSKPMVNYRKSLHFSDNIMSTIFKIAQYEHSFNRINESLSIFVLLSVLEPEDFDYWYRIGIIAYQMQDFDLALRALKVAASLFPDFIEARIFLANCYLKLDQANEAKIEINHIHEVAKESALDPSLLDMMNKLEIYLKK